MADMCQPTSSLLWLWYVIGGWYHASETRCVGPSVSDIWDAAQRHEWRRVLMLEPTCVCVPGWRALEGWEHLYTLTLVLFGFVLVFCAYKIWEAASSVSGNGLRTGYLSFLVSLMDQPTVATCTVRSLFKNCPHVTNFRAANHTHAESARVRNDGSSFMDYFSRLLGRTAFFIQMSAADMRHGRSGNRTYYWAKDLTVKAQCAGPDERDLVCLADVDYHMDMPELLTRLGVNNPVLISTFQPSAVAKSEGEYTFTFNERDEVEYKVSGGASYQHPVWKYGKDVIMVHKRRYLMHHYAVYNVDRRRLDDHHELVLLTPIKRFTSPLFDISSWLDAEVLDRLRVVERITTPTGVELFTRLSINKQDGVYHSTGRPGAVICATLRASDDDAIASTSRTAKNVDLTPASVKQILGETSQAVASLLTEYHRHKTTHKVETVFPVEASVQKFQHYPAQYDPDAKSSMIPFMSPLVMGCYAPDRCLQNDRAAIQGRVIQVNPGDVPVTMETMRYMDEFLERLIPVPHEGHPESVETVRERQNRPAQRMILDRAVLDGTPQVAQAKVQSFQKSETYEKATDPRIISTIPGKNKLHYSCYVYSFTKVLRDTDWYAFALTPKEVASRVAEICTTASKVCLTDLSRFDGRVAQPLRDLEHRAMLRFFHEFYHRDLLELLASQKNQRAVTTYGVKYDTGLSRLSGSAETADFNSMDNAFMAYSALRKTKDWTGHVLSPDEAYAKLGIYGGDDGVTPDADSDAYVAACKTVGQCLEICEVKRGGLGVQFLAREYGPAVWHGAMDSMCDVKRQVTKLHTTVSLPPQVTAFDKAMQKLYSYYLTDKNTPIIGQLARAVVETFPEDVPKNGRLMEVATYNSLVDIDEQYPNSDGPDGWMFSQTQKYMPKFDHGVFQAWLERIRATKNKELVLRAPLCVPADVTHEVKAPVVINGEVVKPAPPAAEKKTPVKARKEYTPEQLAAMKLKPCNDGANCKRPPGKCRYKH